MNVKVNVNVTLSCGVPVEGTRETHQTERSERAKSRIERRPQVHGTRLGGRRGVSKIDKQKCKTQCLSPTFRTTSSTTRGQDFH